MDDVIGFSNFMIPFMTVMMVLFFLTFIATIGLIIFMIVRTVSEQKKNDSQPKLTVPATVLSKRTDLYRRRNMGIGSTVYFVTFQVQSGDRIELHLSGRDFGLLQEGDRGSLTFRGREFLGFTREG